MEKAASELRNTEVKTETAFDKLKQEISEQDKELDKLNQSYKSAVLEHGKDSNEAKTLANQIQALSQKQKENKSQLEGVEKAAHDVTAEEKTLTERLKDQKSELDRLKTEYVNTVAQYGKNSKEAKSLAKEINSLSGEISSEEKQLQKAEQAAGQFDKSVDEIGKTSEKAASGISSAAVAVGTFFGNIAVDTLKWGVDKLKEFTTSTIETGSELQSKMSGVVATLGYSMDELHDPTSKASYDLEMLTDKAKEMGRTTAFSSSEAADALNFMAMAGWKSEQQIAALEPVMNLTAASGEELGTVADIVTDSMTALGLKAEDTSKYADILAAASSNANTNVGMLGESFKYAAPIIGTMSKDEEQAAKNTKDLAIALGTMANAGIKGEQGGSILRNGIINLIKPTKQQAAAMAKLNLISEDGISVFQDEAGNMKSLGEMVDILRSTLSDCNAELFDSEGNLKDYETLLAEVEKSEDGLTKAEQLKNAAIIFGKQNVSGMLSLINASAEDYGKLANAIYNCEGAAEEMAKVKLDNLAGDVTLMKSAFSGLQEAIFDDLDRPLRKIVQSLTNKLLPALTGVIEGKDGAEGVLKSAFVKLLTTISIQLRNILPKILDIMGAIVSAIVQTLPKFTQIAVTLVTSLVQGLIGSLPLLVNAALELVKALTSSIMELIPELIPVVTELVSVFANGLIDNIPLILESAVTLITELVRGIAENLPLMIESAMSLITALTDGLLNALPELLAVLPGLVKQLSDGILQSVDLIIQTGVTLFVSLVDALPDIISDIVKVLPVLITGIVGGLLARLPDLIQAGITLFLALVDALPEIISAITDVIPDIITAVVSAILDNLPAIIDAGFQLFSALIGALPDIIRTVAGIVPKIVSGIVGVLPEVAGKFSEFLQNIGNLAPIITGVVTAFMTFQGIVGIMTAVQSAVSFLTGLPALIAGLPALLSGVSGAFSGLFGVIAANPIVAVVAAVAGLITALVTLWNTNDDFRNALIGIWESIQETLFNFFDNWISGFETIKSALSNAVSAVGDFFSGIWDFFVGYGEYLAEWIQNVKEKFSNILSQIFITVSTVWTNIKTTISSIMGSIQTTIASIWNKVSTAVSSKITGIKNTIVNGFTAAVDFVKNLSSEAWQWGADIVGNIVTGIKGKVNDVSDAVTGVADTIREFLHFSVPDKGPLTDFESWMPDFMQGLADGIFSGQGTIENAVKSCGRAISDLTLKLLSDTFSSLTVKTTKSMQRIDSAIQISLNNIRNFNRKSLNAVQADSSALWNGISGIAVKSLNYTLTAIGNQMNKLQNTVWNGMNKATGHIRNQVNSSWNWGYDLMQNLINGINYQMGNLINTVADVARVIHEYLHFSVPDKGPLTDFESWMPDFMQGLADGLMKNKKVLEKAVASVSKTLQMTLDSEMNLSFAGMADGNVGTVNNYYNTDNSQTFNQTNHSPKSLSRFELYRDGKNLLRQIKKV